MAGEAGSVAYILVVLVVWMLMVIPTKVSENSNWEKINVRTIFEHPKPKKKEKNRHRNEKNKKNKKKKQLAPCTENYPTQNSTMFPSTKNPLTKTIPHQTEYPYPSPTPWSTTSHPCPSAFRPKNITHSHPLAKR